MISFIKGYVKKESRYLTRSSLLDEGKNPTISKMIIVFTAIVTASFFFWAWRLKIDEVALAVGKLVPLDNVSLIQHLDGGIVEKVNVKDGSIVKMGDIIVTFDAQNLDSLLKQSETQRNNLESKLKTTSEKLSIKTKLFKQGLESKVSYLDLQLQVNEIKGKIKESETLIERYQQKLSRLVITAPHDGYVHNLIIENVGQIIGRGETMMEIVPLERPLEAEVRISPDDIGHVKVGQEVTLKFNTFDFAQYGGKQAKLTDISPTTLLDTNANPYFKGRVEMDNNQLNSKHQSQVLKAGMTLIAEVKTGQRTLLQYILKPIYHTASRSFKER